MKILTAAKAWAATIGAGITAAVTFDPSLPHWVSVVAAGLTGLAVYGTPNSEAATTADGSPYVPDLVASAEADPTTVA